MMITCINSKKDSLSTSSVALQYAVRAKAITNVARINVDAEKKSEIEALKAEAGGLPPPPPTTHGATQGLYVGKQCVCDLG